MTETVIVVIEKLLPFIGAFLTAALGLGTWYLIKKTEGIKDENLRKITQDLLLRAHFETKNAVKATAQTYTDAIKEARADGKLTAEEQAEAREIAFNYFKTYMGEAAMRELDNTLGDVHEWFEKYLEHAVSGLKERASAS